ncbi:lysozyme-like protein 6 [Petaurus breviceps papuanus]|uniref:lysozyme-like protein 6 n=1 Tax=Petaurus breviceps papuanus TaxID=3040969 RepID=UPI0036DC0DB1
MKKILFLSFISCLIVANQTKIFKRCELAQEMHKADGYEGISLGDWMCLAYRESQVNTKKKYENAVGSTDYGLFQINSHYWCNDDKSHSKNLGHMNCSELLSNYIFLTILCVKMMVLSSGGIANW